MPGDVEDIEATPPVIESEFVSADDKEDGSIAKQALMAEMSGGMGGPKPDKAAIGEILLAFHALRGERHGRGDARPPHDG